ncbi:MAG: ATP-binding cassette domain-containing protein [Planctomycetota bacterium]|nr:MAG: ATP-binding cassette domain-containing protein [Planctomycetota bacterium]
MEPLLRRRILDLRDKLQADLDKVRSLQAVTRNHSEIQELLDDLDRQLERVRRSPVITLVGATGAGKSTLLNALVGGPIAKEGDDRPTTRTPVVYAPQDSDLKVFLKGLQEKPKVVRYEPGENTGRWTGQIFIDAPDVNSVAASHRELVSALADRSDVLVAVMHRQSVVEKAAVSFLEQFTGRRRLIFVLNRADELTGESRAMLLQQIRWLAGEELALNQPKVLAISARQAKAGEEGEGAFDWPDLCALLDQYVGNQKLDGLRGLNAIGTAQRLQRYFEQAQTSCRQDLQQLPKEVADGLDRLALLTSQDVEARLELRKPDVANLLWTETAKRWDGPCGWALRSGGLSGLGLGASTFFMARNPVIAAGAAGAAVATSKVRQVARKRRVATGAEELLPADADFQGWYGESLGEARLRTARLAGKPDALGVPDGDTALERTMVAVEDSWTHLVDRELPESAARSVARPVRLALDIPVYAFLAWVVFGAIVGFFKGDYLGIDYLINALLILVVYMVVLRFFMRRYLLLRTGRLLSGVMVKMKATLQDTADRAREEVSDEIQRVEKSLTGLSELDQSWQVALQGTAAGAEADGEK